MSANVLFKKLTRAQFDALLTKDNGTFYRVVETDLSENFYEGAKKLNNEAEIAAAIAALDTESDVTIASEADGVVTIKAGISETDGIIGAGSGSDITLAKVATTGASEDISYDNTTSGLTADDVQEAIDALAVQSAGGVSSKTVYATKTNGGAQDVYAARYTIYQGSTGSAASPVAGEKVIDIDVLKDQFVDESDLVDITFSEGHLYDGVTDVTEIIKGTGSTAVATDAGKYIKLVFAQTTKNPIYLKVDELIDVYTPEANATQIQVAIDGNNVISASVVAGSIDTTELADGAVTTAKLDDEAVTTGKIDDEAVTTAKIDDEAVTLTKLASDVQTSLSLADTAVQSVTASDPTTGTNGTFEVDGVEVAVKGLGTAAFTDTTAYDIAGSSLAAENNAKAYAEGLLTWEDLTSST